MSQVRSAQTPFQMRKRSFDLAWGAWVGILAVMTAVGAALAGSQILLMYPRPVQMMEFKYPSLPKADSVAAVQLNRETVALYWSAEGVMLGRISDLAAPLRPGELLLKRGQYATIGTLGEEIREWCKKNLKAPVIHLALGQSVKQQGLTMTQISEVVSVFRSVNENQFDTTNVAPVVIPFELLNPL
ncbi:MAG: hypothetical protein FJY29_06990 [Betaproteobacteria bacterium]|nr:hypothetical protein [Betaproteobacteria bacterium]